MENTNTVLVLNGLQSIRDFVVGYMVPLAAASGLTVALLEAFKKLFSIRGAFHRRAVARWLAEDHMAIQDGGNRALQLIHGTAHYDVVQGSRTAKAMGEAIAAGRSQTGQYSSAPEVFAVYDSNLAYQQLRMLTTGIYQPDVKISMPRKGRFRSVERAVFELELARMMSQIQDAADAVLQEPTRMSVSALLVLHARL
ncbi:MAG: hypothetical protein AB3X44_20870 [Leptothrix sp. (in: b-proteobacteria)]